MKRYLMSLLAVLSLAALTRAQETIQVKPMPKADDGKVEVVGPAVTAEGSPVVEWAAPEDGCPQGCTWFRAEYLRWWIHDGPNHEPLVTTGSDPDRLPGALGQPRTVVLSGGRDIEYDSFNGLRLTVGRTMGEGSMGVEASGFVLEQRSQGFSAFSDNTGAPILARPLITTPGAFGSPGGTEGVFFVTLPGVFSGGVDVRSTSQLWGAEVMSSANVYSDGGLTAGLLVGARYLHLEEDLAVNERSTALTTIDDGVAGTLPAGSADVINDRFATYNSFYGGQIAARAAYSGCNLSVELGATHQHSNVEGLTAFFDPAGAPLGVVPGGLLALPSNSGNFEHNKFTAIPEVNLNVAYQMGRLRLMAGYTFLYWDNVVRPGDQVDRVINETQIPSESAAPVFGAVRPAAALIDNHVWVQGVSLGAEIRY